MLILAPPPFSWKPIMEHVDMQFEKYLNAESRVLREALEDHRIHCCLYFIAPTGHRCAPVCVCVCTRTRREGRRKVWLLQTLCLVFKSVDTFHPALHPVFHWNYPLTGL